MITGKHITITNARNKQLIGINGTVVDETQHTLIIKTAHGKKTIIKEHIEETK